MIFDRIRNYVIRFLRSLVTTMKSNIIIGVAAHQKNEHDSKTLEAALSSANKNRTKPIVEAICNRGYRGKKEVDDTVTATAFNFKTWMNNFLAVHFLYRMVLLGTILYKVEAKERRKYADLYLLWFRVW